MACGLRRLRWATLALAVISLAVASSASAKLGVTWMKGYAAPGTPAKYNKVGVIKVGSRHARNVLVLEPGTSAGGGYFVPLAQWIVSRAPGWQVWSVERRENLLEDQSELNLAKEHKVTVNQMFDYYLGYLADSERHPPHPTGPRLGGAVRAPVGAEGRRGGPARRHRRGPQARRARSCSAATRSAARWSRRMPPGTSPASPAPMSWPVSSTTTVAARRRPVSASDARAASSPRCPRARRGWPSPACRRRCWGCSRPSARPPR